MRKSVYESKNQSKRKKEEKNLLCLHNKYGLVIFGIQSPDLIMKPQETIDYHLKVTWQAIANKYNQIAAGFGITQSVGYLLINIHESEGTTVSEVASLLGLKSTSLSRMLNNLEKDGLIFRQIHQNDKRSVKVYLTDKGKEKRHLARVVVRKFNDYLDSHLSEREREILINSLIKINTLTTEYEAD